MANYFDLEQAIQECWCVTTDIKDMSAAGASAEDMAALTVVYNYRFEKLWAVFETMVHNRQFKN